MTNYVLITQHVKRRLLISKNENIEVFIFDHIEALLCR